MNTRRLIIMLAIAIAAFAWIFRAPLPLEMTRVGEISSLALLLLVVAVITLLAGALRVQFGRSGRLSFVLHLGAVGIASVLMRSVVPIQLVLSGAVAIVALAWPSSAQQAIADDAPKTTA